MTWWIWPLDMDVLPVFGHRETEFLDNSKEVIIGNLEWRYLLWNSIVYSIFYSQSEEEKG